MTQTVVRRFCAALFLLIVLGRVAPQAYAQIALTQLSQDSYTNTSSQHATEVEPGSFAYGSTIVTAFQVARIFSGGGADVGFATSKDGGKTWSNGYLQGITVYQGGGNLAASDAAVAYDARHGQWLISTLPISYTTTSVAVSRSSDGVTWSGPIFVTRSGSPDKNWITCDNGLRSPYFGHCYVEWDDTSKGDLIYISTSTDGGKTWGAPQTSLSRSTGIGGVPVVQPNGIVVVPYADLYGNMVAFTSRNGGMSWTTGLRIATVTSHAEAGGIRSGGLPASAVDAAGNVYVVWPDCRYRAKCASNDLVMSTSRDGSLWNAVTRIPIDPVTSTVDHFITGLSVDPNTSGGTAHLGLVYYYYPVSNCTTSTCKLYAGFIHSGNGGQTWFAPTTLSPSMSLTWLPNTFSGYMVADYITVAYANGLAYPIFSLAFAKSGSLFHQAIYTTTAGFSGALATAEMQLSSTTDRPVPNAKSDHGPMQYYDLDHEKPIPGRGGKPPMESELEIE